jgi:hypothetical protein
MSSKLNAIPERVSPYLVMQNLNEPITAIPGPLQLIAPGSSIKLDGDVSLCWLPSPCLEFQGLTKFPPAKFGSDDWSISGQTPEPFKVLAHLTHLVPGPSVSALTGIPDAPIESGRKEFESLRFCLVNFPDYFGLPIRYNTPHGDGFLSGRLSFGGGAATCVVDEIHEVASLRKQFDRSGGFLVTHVGLWKPTSGKLTSREAKARLTMLHYWFAFLRGAWAGPIFGQGLVGDEVVWQEFASWRLDESVRVPSWLPDQPGDLSNLFKGFELKFSSPAWEEPHNDHFVVGRSELQSDFELLKDRSGAGRAGATVVGFRG